MSESDPTLSPDTLTAPSQSRELASPARPPHDTVEPHGLSPINGRPCGKGGCTAHSRHGRLCSHAVTPGAAVCYHHGGWAPQVREAAKRRIDALLVPAINRIGEHMRQKKAPALSLQAAKAVVEMARTNLEPPEPQAPHGFLPPPGTTTITTTVKVETLTNDELDTMERLLLKLGVKPAEKKVIDVEPVR